ncbi:MAG: HlyD family efflux transporter periplasmic adaptor subunit [Bacteroidota bacterium]
MDRAIKKRFWTSGKIFAFSGGGLLISFFVYSFLLMDVRSSLNVDREKVRIHTIETGNFQEFIQVTGTVQPIKTIFLDAIEGGVVQNVMLETGTLVEEGAPIIQLSNSNLQLQVLQQEASLYDQINNVRNSRLNLEQNSLQLKEQLANAEYQLELLKPQYERQKQLYEQDLASLQEFEEVAENYEFQQKRYALNYESFVKDSVQTLEQLKQLNDSEQRMWRSLDAVQSILNNLLISAPIEGQLTTIDLQQGQSISPGERIGQVDILDQFKVRVPVDEFHLPRIVTGLAGSFVFSGTEYDLKITKVYPVIDNGQFQVDMEFTGEVPDRIRRGQSLRIRLELGDADQAVLLARSGFYQTTGGNWIFKLAADGKSATRQEIKLGRQNPEYFEVLDGLSIGDQVIISSYSTFGNNEILNLN